MTAVAHRRTCTFDHDAFIYDSDAGYVAALAPLIEEAHAAGDVVHCVVPHRNAALLREVLAACAPATEFIAAEEWYRHPVTTVQSYVKVLRSLPTGTRAFVVGEVQFGDTEADWTAWTRYEAALNRVLEHYDARVICPYDARVLPASVIVNARHTHPYLLTASDAAPSGDYLDAKALFRLLPETIEIPTTAPGVDVAVDANLREARRAFVSATTAMGLGTDRVEELTLGVGEVLANALVHGGGTARLRVWSTGGTLICVVDDSGSGLTDPLIGFTGPPPGSPGGYGTWLARRLFERSDFRTSPTGGLTVVLATRS